jgi:hypothetical protein
MPSSFNDFVMSSEIRLIPTKDQAGRDAEEPMDADVADLGQLARQSVPYLAEFPDRIVAARTGLRFIPRWNDVRCRHVPLLASDLPVGREAQRQDVTLQVSEVVFGHSSLFGFKTSYIVSFV